MSATLSEYELHGLSEFEWEGEDEFESEFEYEDEFEGEDEFGDILGGIARGIGGLLGESEYEDELEYELEGEFEGEAESEAFFGKLAGLAKRAIASPALRKLAMRGAKAALGGLNMPPGAVGALGHVATLLTESEEEGEYEGEYELNPVRKVYPDAMLEHLGHAATEAETEGEAFAFLAPLVPLAAKAVMKLAPKAIGMLAKSTPKLVRGLTNVGKTLYRNPSTRPLMRVLPSVAKRTVNAIAKQVAHGRPVSATSAVRTLARQTARALGHPHQSVKAYQRSKALDRRFHAMAPKAVKREMVQLARDKRAAQPQMRVVRGPHGQPVRRPHYRRWIPGYGWRWIAGTAGRYVGGTPGRYVGGTPGRYVGGTPGRYVGGTAGRYVGGSPGRYVGGTAGRYLGGTPGRYVGSTPGRYVAGTSGRTGHHHHCHCSCGR